MIFRTLEVERKLTIELAPVSILANGQWEGFVVHTTEHTELVTARAAPLHVLHDRAYCPSYCWPKIFLHHRSITRKSPDLRKSETSNAPRMTDRTGMISYELDRSIEVGILRAQSTNWRIQATNNAHWVDVIIYKTSKNSFIAFMTMEAGRAVKVVRLLAPVNMGLIRSPKEMILAYLEGFT
ncbi:hypothetical protein K488DRAFT_75286 [Vararia minispora EC-137]|uniref:Uncharacterized protein n=1 Tax=Vararia minispora EC-137 TaxID=1314806 RepID=A0ACB8Q4P3_9AGAM|nr:hypothetical protein K488DRAFT_75286 [Vararia minispora EC-137]